MPERLAAGTEIKKNLQSQRPCSFLIKATVEQTFENFCLVQKHLEQEFVTAHVGHVVLLYLLFAHLVLIYQKLPLQRLLL
jgi:hypothetical protein